MFGDGLTVVIACQYRLLDHFLAFGTYYSFLKNLPDAKVVVACRRGEPSLTLFSWTKKMDVPLVFHTRDDGVETLLERGLANLPILIVSPFVVLVRTPEDLRFEGVRREAGTDASSVDPVNFASVEGGCGRFDPGRWLDTDRCPLGYGGGVTVNERKVFDIWHRAKRILETL